MKPPQTRAMRLAGFAVRQPPFRYNTRVDPPVVNSNSPDVSGKLRSLPSMTELLALPEVEAAVAREPRSLVAGALRSALSEARNAVLSGADPPDCGAIAAAALVSVTGSARASLRRAINLTGVVLHTGLGRAVLPESARRAVAEAAAGHCLLEIDAESGRRGSRQDHAAGLLRELTGAEAAIALNNNAGAVFLSITALAQGREVILSRGELVEIGGSFRLPDIIRASGATLVEVGTTNRTRLSDFESAINERTGLLLRCHPSNFRVVGFTEEAPLSGLARLGRERGVPVMDDLGSGAILEPPVGAGGALTLRGSLDAGSDLVTASGDKLLGGPQAGIIVGRSSLVQRIASHPLARALRADKLTLAALEATLRLYRDPERARAEIPALAYLARTPENLSLLAERLRDLIVADPAIGAEIDLVEGHSQVGGGSLPGENLPTTCVRIRTRVSADSLAGALRMGDPPVFGRIRDDAVLLDPRTLDEAELPDAAQAVSAALAAQRTG